MNGGTLLPGSAEFDAVVGQPPGGLAQELHRLIDGGRARGAREDVAGADHGRAGLAARHFRRAQHLNSVSAVTGSFGKSSSNGDSPVADPVTT